MNDESGALVFWILVPLFVVVGLYLIWYSRRRKKMHQHRIRPECEKELQRTLDTYFSLKGKGLLRSFGQLSSLVDGESIWLFRTVELLDLNPHAQSYSTHYSRIVALFDISTDHDEFFILDKSFLVHKILSGSKSPNPYVVDISKQIAKSCEARPPLSITLTRGVGLIYFEPLVTGGETLSDINSLYFIAKNMCGKLY